MFKKILGRGNEQIMRVGITDGATSSALDHVPSHGRPASNEDHVDIKNVGSVPEYTAILTAPGAANLYRLPVQFEFQLMALEVGPNKAALFYSLGGNFSELSHYLSEVKNTLVAKGYAVDTKYFVCANTVIKESLEHYKRQGSVSKGAFGESESKKLWESWTEIAYRENASDFHIFFMGNHAIIKIRVNGTLEPLPDANEGIYTATTVTAAISWAYQELTVSRSNNTSMYDERQDVNSMFKPITVDGKQVKARFQSLIGAYGPKITCRLIRDVASMSYAKQGFEKCQIEMFNEVARRSTGLLISAGVTNSGKSTFLRTYMESHPDNGAAAFTVVEDAVEAKIKGTHQYPFQRPSSDQAESKKLYDDLIAGLLRSDPDGVVMGEVRDAPSAGAVETIVKTGCFAVCTLHANFISGIIPRLTDKSIGIDLSVLTQEKMISLLMYQSLVPLLCDECAIGGHEKDKFAHIHHVSNSELDAVSLEYFQSEVEDTLQVLQSRFELPAERFRFKREKGCAACKGRGTKGLTVVAEVFIPDVSWLELVARGEYIKANKYYRKFSDNRFDTSLMTGKTVFEHALYKAQLGLIDPRSCLTFDSFKKFEINKSKDDRKFNKFKRKK